MYLQNKYTKCYYSIINQAKSRSVPTDIYTERHHVIPKSLGGDNSPNNLVVLSAREHFVCHWLLTKMLVGSMQHKMVYALRGMQRKGKSQHRYETKTTARVYARVKEVAAQIHSQRIVSADTRKKISDSKKGKSHPQSQETKDKIGRAHCGLKKPPLTDAHKQRISEHQTGLKKPACSAERKAKISLALQGKSNGPMSSESKAKLAASKSGKKRYTDPITGRRYMA